MHGFEVRKYGWAAECDLLIAVGALRTATGSTSGVCPARTGISHIDINLAEIGKDREPHGAHRDAKVSSRLLNERRTVRDAKPRGRLGTSDLNL